jgi:hypothetical protein
MHYLCPVSRFAVGFLAVVLSDNIVKNGASI